MIWNSLTLGWGNTATIFVWAMLPVLFFAAI